MLNSPYVQEKVIIIKDKFEKQYYIPKDIDYDKLVDLLNKTITPISLLFLNYKISAKTCYSIKFVDDFIIVKAILINGMVKQYSNY
jgi:hypothetical protein